MLLGFLWPNRRIGRLQWFASQGLIALIVTFWAFAPQIINGQPMVFKSVAGELPNYGAFDTWAWSSSGLIAFGVLFCWIWACATANRLHDLSRSGLWVLVPLGISATTLYLVFVCKECLFDPRTYMFMTVANIAQYAIGMFLTYYCGTLAGDPADNEWGGPGGAPPASAFAEKASAPGRISTKISDDYLANYARELASKQAAAQAEPGPPFGGGSTPSFGRRQ